MAIKTTDKERAKRKVNKIYLIVASVIYVYVVCTVLQYMAIARDNKRMEVSEIINTAMMKVFTDPLNVFPISGATIGYLFLATVVVGVIGYSMYLTHSLRKADNPDTVNGEAHLMTLDELNEYNLKFSAPLGQKTYDGYNNMILSKEIRLAIDNRGTRRNCNVLVIGGSGAGKTRFFAAPNILQYNANFVITDPSGEMLRDYGKALENHGYKVSVFNLTDVYHGNRYNPFHYIHSEKDVFTLVNTLIKNTTPAEGHSGDPFWEKCENLLLTALILYLWHVYDEEQQTFTNVLKLLNMAEVDENDASAESPLDKIFKDLKNKDPHNLAVRQYAKFKQGAGKTLKSILISVGVRLQSFDLKDIEYLTSKDDLNLESFADTRQALFVITPTADTTFSFLVSLLYSQLFSTLYELAETTAKYGYRICAGHETILVKQAKNEKDSAKAKKYCESILKEIKNGDVEVGYFKDDKFISGKMEPEKKIYKLYTKKSQVYLGHRGTKEAITEFANSLEKSEIKPCEPRCINHVRFILDEFANIGEIPDFDQKLATMRKYEISCSIIVQALSQLKVMYKDRWNTIVANCDTKLFLGCDNSETIDWMLKMLGKKTTAVKNMSENGNGSISQSINRSSLELLTIDQISMMQDSECLVRIRGVRPYYGKKFELTEHKNYAEAHSLYDQFFIPISDEALRERDQCGPLRNRNKGDAVDEASSQAENKTSSSVPNINKEGNQHSVQSKESNTEKENEPEIAYPAYAPVNSDEKPKGKTTEEQKVNNRARRDNAKDAEKELENEFIVESVQDILDKMNLKPGASESEIKESIESLFAFDTFPDDDQLVYTMTN